MRKTVWQRCTTVAHCLRGTLTILGSCTRASASWGPVALRLRVQQQHLNLSPPHACGALPLQNPAVLSSHCGTDASPPFVEAKVTLCPASTCTSQGTHCKLGLQQASAQMQSSAGAGAQRGRLQSKTMRAWRQRHSQRASMVPRAPPAIGRFRSRPACWRCVCARGPASAGRMHKARGIRQEP